MRKLLLSLTLLSGLLLSPSSSRAQFIVVGQACGASGLNGIANDGTPVVCRGNASGALVWTGVGGGGGGGVPGQFSVKTYGAVGDAKKTPNAVTTNNSSTITDATNAPWLSTDVGKKIFCIGLNGNSALSTTISTISTVNSASSISIAPATGNNQSQNPSSCVWFTQKDTAAFCCGAGSATAAAIASATSQLPGNLANGYNATVFCPPGGYVIDGSFFVQNSANANTRGVSFIGAGEFSCQIYVSPDIAAASSAWLALSVQNGGQVFSDFSVDCSGEALAVAGQGFRIVNAHQLTIRNLFIKGCGTSGDANGIIFLSGAAYSLVDNLFIDGNGLPASNAEISLNIANGSTALHVRNYHTSNPGPVPLQVAGSCGPGGSGSQRSVTGGGCIFENLLLDEGGNPGALNIVGSTVNVIGASMFAGTGTVVTVDGTSSLFLSNSNLVSFGAGCSGGNRNAITIASGGQVFSSGNTIAGCGSGAAGTAISGPAGATYVDYGANTLENCTAGTCVNVTPATYATTGFSGGIVPKATVTHTPNTCYAVTGNLLATAQNLCTLLLDQNYQVVNATAQSGGTTPTNSACATPPVITMSDGTRSFTMTMTTGKTQWSSSVDAVTNLNQVFASGATLTVSIGANTCATPPTNVSVNYVLQSVLNP